MKSLSGKELDPEREVSAYQFMILGGLQDKTIFKGKPPKVKKRPKDKLALRRRKNDLRVQNALEAHEHRRRIQNLVV